MNRNTLVEIVREQQQDIRTLPQGTHRERLSDLINALTLPHIVAITGIRRCGKSTLMLQAIRQAINEPVYYLDFEDERLLEFDVSDFNLLYEIFLELYGERRIFLFDEIQIIGRWETYLRRMYKTRHKFIISGSSAELLSSELSTKLTGRHIAIELLPFSFCEYLSFIGSPIETDKPLLTKDRGLLKNAFNHYLHHGGIPEYLQYKNPIIVKSVYENILYKDVIVRYDIKAVKALRELALMLISNPGSLISYTKIKNILQLGSVNTVKNFIHYLENAYLIFTVDRFAYSVGQQTSAPKKIYVIDTAMTDIIGFQSSRNTGKSLENIVYLALRRRQEHDIFYYKTDNNLEVDFCLAKGHQVLHLIQVTEQMHTPQTRKREVRSLVAAMAELDMTEGLILTLDQEETIQIDIYTIHVTPIVNWLLAHNHER